MKKVFALIFLVGILFSACKKDPDVVSQVVEVTYPTITLNGPEFVHIPVGGSYTDAGAVLTDDITGAQSQIMPTASELDVDNPGLYQITFEAANANGFVAQAIRGVLVLNYTPPAGLDSTFDLSGNYERAVTGVVVTITRMANGLYITNNVGGSVFTPAYFVTPDTTSFDMPLQITFGGLELEAINENIDFGPPMVLSYNILADGFGGQARFFERLP